MSLRKLELIAISLVAAVTCSFAFNHDEVVFAAVFSVACVIAGAAAIRQEA